MDEFERKDCVGRISKELDKGEGLMERALSRHLPRVEEELDCILSDLQADASDEMGMLEKQQLLNEFRAARGRVAEGLADILALHQVLYNMAQEREIDDNVVQPRSGGR